MYTAALTVPFLPSDITTFVTSLIHFCLKPVMIIEYYLQPLTGENLRYKTAVSDDDAHLDIHAAVFGV